MLNTNWIFTKWALLKIKREISNVIIYLYIIKMKDVDVIYNRYGQPILRLIEISSKDYRFVDFQWNHLGFYHNTCLYNYFWMHVWRFEQGIMRDLQWYCVWFWEQPTDLLKPLLPLKQLKPLFGLIPLPPAKPLTMLPYMKPLKSFFWSNIDPIMLFFNQSKNA